MTKNTILSELRQRNPEIRARYKVRRLTLFGSAARDEMREESDVDILVDFEGPATFDGYMDLKFYLEDLLKCKVDLVTEKALRKELRPFVEKDAIHVA